MRKLLATIALLLFEGLAAIMLESIIPSWLFDPPWIFVLFGFSCVPVILLWLPEIRSLVDEKERRIRRGRTKLGRADREARRSKEEFYGRPYF